MPVRNIKYACQNHDFCVNFPKYVAAKCGLKIFLVCVV